MKISIPENANFILDTLEKSGYKAYVVGGCVRDSLLGIFPEDWDITTSAEPCEVKALFPKTFDTGLKHGTVSVLVDNEIFEVTTFRCDGEYKDNRRPEQVTFTKFLEEDLSRRDFTVNAMAYSPKDGLIDPFGGMDDLQNKIIRCVGKADKRYQEDALRMLRAVRFAAQKDFSIEEDTCHAIRRNASLVQNLSVERVISEFTKILLSDHLERIETLYDVGLLAYMMPELCRCFETTQNIKWHIYDVGRHSLHATKHMDKKPYLRYSALMHDWGKPLTKGTNPDGSDSFRNHAKESVRLAEDFMERYKFSNNDKDKILRLIKHHDREIIPEKKYVKRAVNAVGEDIFLDLLNLKRADAKSQNFALTEPRLAIYDELEFLYNTCKDNNEVFSLKNLAVNGNDVVAFGYRGKEIGEVLNSLLNYVIDHPEENKKEILLKKLKTKKEQ